MNGVLVTLWPGAQSLQGLSPRVEERWLNGQGKARRRFTAATVLVLAVSLLLHVGLVATALFKSAPTRPPAEQEISVEVVPEPVKPPASAKKVEAPSAAASPAPEPPPPPAPQKAAETAPPPPPQPPAPAKDEPPALKPSLPPPPMQPASSEPSKSDAELKALQDELASLRDQQAALAQEKATASMEPMATPSAGQGPLAESFQAIALPSQGVGEGDVVGYAAIVFSQLAKAKDIGEQMGQPGSTAVRFDIDDKGALVDVAMVMSSGIKSLDDEAIAIVHKAAPFPAPPPGAQRSFSANVSFVGRPTP